MKRFITSTLLLSVCFGVNAAAISGQGTWEAALQGRLPLTPGGSDFQAYYDTEADLTWLADANYAQTGGYDVDGEMNWADANAWAASLIIGGVDGWRLPEIIDVGNDGPTYTNLYQGVDTGFNITTHSEMSNMFYNVLGNIAWYDTNGLATGCGAPDYCLTNTGPFSNLQSERYWSATEVVDYGDSWAWAFNFLNGDQYDEYNKLVHYAWAVHDGDVGALSQVPLPGAVWLLGSALIGLIGAKKYNRR